MTADFDAALANLAAYDAERDARAEKALVFARDVLGVQLTTMQEQTIRALYHGGHVYNARPHGLRTVERVITEFEAEAAR
jgi:hypothetical protein